MQPTHRAWAAAAAATGAGAGLLALGQPGAAIALATAGLGTGLLVTERGAPAERAAQAALGATMALASLAKAFHLEGRAILVPPGPTLPEPRCFLPARAAGVADLPLLDAATVVHRAPPGVVGLALPPSGWGLAQAWSASEGLPSAQGLEAATDALRKALPALGLGEEVGVERAGSMARVRYRPTLLESICAWTRGPGAPWHLQGMCPTCSFVHILVAVATGRPVPVREVALEGRRVVLTLEVGPSSPA
jgi:hypothetical protein